VFGRDVVVGDVIFGVNGNDELERTQVLEITHHVTRGAYVPLTKEGTLIVDGIYVSCYASYRHALAHRFLAPVRLFPALLHLRPGFLRRLGAWAKSLVTGSAFVNSGTFSVATPTKNYPKNRKSPNHTPENYPKNRKLPQTADEVDEGEGEAYYIAFVKIIGRLLYRGERVGASVWKHVYRINKQANKQTNKQTNKMKTLSEISAGLMLLLLLLLLVKEGECRECYSCSDCSTVSTSTFTTTCPASCLAIVTCLAGKAPRVTRSCSLTNEPSGCSVISNPTDYTKACYCDDERCDPILGLSQDQLCDGAVSSFSSLASFALIFVAFFVVQVLGVGGGLGCLSF
ncbi:hypothetical protein Pmani_039569, partial [Petrolisthes manimaculis]